MKLYFNIKKSLFSRYYKLWSFFPFKNADILSQAFFYLSLISFIGYLFGFWSVHASVFFAILFILFFEISIFFYFKIAKPDRSGLLIKALSKEELNLADVLDFPSISYFLEAVDFCGSMKLPEIGSEALLYVMAQKSEKTKNLLAHFGFEPAEILTDLKNYMEKQRRMAEFRENLSESLRGVFERAIKASSDYNMETVGENEIFLGFCERAPFFKDILVKNDLADWDIEHIFLWVNKFNSELERKKMFGLRKGFFEAEPLGQSFSFGYTRTLDLFTIDWATRRGLSEIFVHKKEIREIEESLSKTGQRNVLLVGEPGSGKKSIVRHLAEKCRLDFSLPELNGRKIIGLDLVAISAAAQNPEQLESILEEVFEEAISVGNIILVIDQLENFLEGMSQKPGFADISLMLERYLSSSRAMFIGITTPEGFGGIFERKPYFLRNFTKIEVPETSETETVSVLLDLAVRAEKKRRIIITYPAIKEIVNLTSRYMPSLPFPKKAVDVLNESISMAISEKKGEVLSSHAALSVYKKTGIPVGKMNFKEKSVLLELENLMHRRIINQEEAISEIAAAMRRARSGIENKKRPMGTFLFLGPTGVGKTETAKALSEIYFGSEDKMIRIDMSEFQNNLDIYRLIGSSAGGQKGILTSAVREKPFSLVLFDEIEKAHPDILNLFLQMLDEGYIADGYGRKAVFYDAIIICTSNAGAKLIFDYLERGKPLNKKEMLDHIFQDNVFKPEFVNRFDATVFFHPLSKNQMAEIADMMLKGVKKNLEEKEITFEITESLKEKIIDVSYEPEFGARAMRRSIQDRVESEIARSLLSDELKRGDKFEINPDNFKIHVFPRE